uniref:Putative ovule protein n=1 Tax=Solanum chacoense TaxID=4108 RepID=A0A0V0H2L0_SOLCH
MAGSSMWRATTRLLVATTALGGGAAAATIASSDDPAMALKLCTNVPLRLYRDSVTAATIAFGTLLIQS